jgi:hypothetical protein
MGDFLGWLSFQFRLGLAPRLGKYETAAAINEMTEPRGWQYEGTRLALEQNVSLTLAVTCTPKSAQA